MPLSLYDASVPVFLRYLAHLLGLVDKAEHVAQERGIRPSELLEAKLAPDDRSVFDWALSRNADPEAANQTTQFLRNTPRHLVSQSIAVMLAPASAAEAVELYWLLQIQGNPAQASAALRKPISLGIPLPIQP